MTETISSVVEPKGRTRSRRRYSPPDQVVEVSPEGLLGPLSAGALLKAPGLLYASGDLGLLSGTLRVAVVGSRKASEDGVRRARKLASQLARAGVVVVSGLAAGVDCAAHLGAIGVKAGRTIAVLGTPLDRAYPADHGPLQERLCREHLVVSQFRSGSRTYPSNFVARNRTMALMVHASVIVEAGDRSGTLTQAKETLRLGRPVFLMRNNLARHELRWPTAFREAGAEVLDDVGQILECITKEETPGTSR